MDHKHYILTPPKLWALLQREFGQEIFDPCPFPRPPGYDGLIAEWGEVNYVNPPFHAVVDENGKRMGPTAWVKKCIAEQKKGHTSIMVLPTQKHFHWSIQAGVEIRSLGELKFLSIEDGKTARSAWNILMFVFRGHKKE